MAEAQTTLTFENNRLLPALFGPQNQVLQRLEALLNLEIAVRGNRVQVSGPQLNVARAEQILQHLYHQVERGHEINRGEVDILVRHGEPTFQEVQGGGLSGAVAITTRKRPIHARTPRQGEYIQKIRDKELVFGLGPAGTGKTYLAVACGLQMLLEGEVERLILSRPAVEAGERLGFLPGDLKEKVDPYLQPLYDALRDMMTPEQVARRMTHGEIEVAPLAFMRGRTLSRAFVILDEAQNTTRPQMKMFLTRLGEGSRMVVTGDLSQIDLPRGTPSGLVEAVRILQDVPDIGVVTFDSKDVVRHPLVSQIVDAYDTAEEEA